MTTAWTPQERSRAIQWRNHGRTVEFIAKRLDKPLFEFMGEREAA